MDKALVGKTVAVTGCTGGIGGAFCRKIAEQGAAIIMVDRNAEKSRAFARELRNEFPSIEIMHLTADLEDMEAVKAVTERLCELQPDYFVSNAGTYRIPRRTCTTGYDNIFQVNFVSPFYIISELAKRSKGTHFVAVGSIAHAFSRIDEGDIDLKKCKNEEKVYGNSKRFLMLALHNYFCGTDALSVVHPGISYTNFMTHYPRAISALIKYPMKIQFMSPKKACRSLYMGLFTPTPFGSWIGPRVLDIWGKPKLSRLKACKSEDVKIAAEVAEMFDFSGIYPCTKRKNESKAVPTY